MSVIIPTTCETARAQFLTRAIDSVIKQEGVLFEVLVVVNGDNVDQERFNCLFKSDKIKTIKVAEGNVSNARYCGLLASRGDFFCFLDDDDELLDNSLFDRVSYLENNDKIDVVVSNGYVYSDTDELLIDDKLADCVIADPVAGFFLKNWFASAGPMFRRSKVDAELFNIKVRYYELTYLFFSIVSSLVEIKFINVIGYRIYTNHDVSASRSDAYILAEADVLLEISKLPLHLAIKKVINLRHSSALHSISQYFLCKNRLNEAWLAHLKCLRYGGWRYFSYTRHLLFRT